MAPRADYQEIMDFPEPPAMVPGSYPITTLRVEADDRQYDAPNFDCPFLPRTPRRSDKCHSGHSGDLSGTVDSDPVVVTVGNRSITLREVEQAVALPLYLADTATEPTAPAGHPKPD